MGDTRKEILEDTREEWKSDHLGLLIGYKHRMAPNQITGNLVDLFLSEGQIPNVVKAVADMKGWRKFHKRTMNEEEKEILKTLLTRLSVISHVVNSREIVQVC